MVSLIKFILTLNIIKDILVPIHGSELNSADNNAEPVPIDVPTTSDSFLYPEIVMTEPIEEPIELIASLHDSDVTVSTSSSRCYGMKVHASYEDTFKTARTFYDKEFRYICNNNDNGASKEVLFSLPDSLAYFDEQNLENPTNFYVKAIEIYMYFFTTNGDFHSDKYITFELVSPWFRKPRPRYSANWELNLWNRMKWKYIPICEPTYDVNIFSSVLALPAKEIGFTRALKPLNWPSHAPEHVRTVFESDSRVTVTLWVFLNGYCPSGLCMIFQHRDALSYHTPLILLNEEGAFHIQLHCADGTAVAFLSGPGSPLKTWIYVVLAIGGVRAELTLSVGNEAQAPEYVHIGHAPFHFNATVGVLAVGGYIGSLSFNGFVGPVKLYRDMMMNVQHAMKDTLPIRQRLDQLKLSTYIDNCTYLKPRVCRFVLGLSTDYPECQVQYWNKSKLQDHSSVKNLHVHVDGKVLSGYLLGKLQDALKKRSERGAVYSLKEYSKILYKRTVKNLEKQALANSVIARLFEISGCLGYPKGYYASAVMHKYGFGVKVNIEKTHQLHLIAALHDYPLAHLALAYRHELGIDGSPKDLSIVAGYLRNTAVTTKAIIEREEQDVVTHTEMVRLDQAHFFRNVRGSNSQLVKWLTHQANMGSGEAQNKMAEILYHGREGAAVDRNQALQFYQMAAALNDPSALFNLGVMHLKGINVKKNETKAFQFFKKAAEHNNSIAFNAIAFVELSHHNNRSGAVYYWKKAADLEDADGLNNYAQMLETGLKEGDLQNHTEAYKYYERAANKGSKNACIRLGDYILAGVYTERDLLRATSFYRFVADQVNDVGVCLKEAINAYLEEDWYKSLFHHLLLNEAGLQLGGYNTALLLDEYKEYVDGVLATSDPYYFYNLTAEQGWSLSLIAMGHQSWYNKSSRKNLKKASLYYARSIERNNHPEALFNLGYIVEYGYPMHNGIQVKGVKDFPAMNRNLTMALQLYQSCIDSDAEEKEGYYPCQIAVLWIKLKIYLVKHRNMYYLVALLPIAVASILTYIKVR